MTVEFNDGYLQSAIERQDAILRDLFPLVYRQLHQERKYDFCNEQHRKDYNRRVKELVCL